MDDSDLALIEDGLGKVVADADIETIVSRLDEFGWFTLCEEEPGTAVRLLFSQQGTHAASAPILALAMALRIGDLSATAPPVGAASGLVLPALGTSTPPATAIAGSDDVTVDGVVLGGTPEQMVVLADVDGEYVFGDLTPSASLVQPGGGLDPDLGLRRVTGGAQFSPRAFDGHAAPLAAWHDAVSIGRLALASELTGIGDRVLRRAVEYAATRHQFGRALGSFQAVKHQLAEVEVDLTVARSAVLEAAADGGHVTATLAKLLAGRAATRAVGRAQQVFGGIGFTWEHGLHRDVRRVITLDSLLGTSAALERELGTQLCASRSAPKLAAV
jgi:hypothetical protein